MQHLKNSLINSPIVMKGNYPYFVHPITDGIPELRKELLQEITKEILKIGNFNCDKIITAEAMGIPIATMLTQKTGIPFNIIRKKQYNLQGEVVVLQRTGYSETKLFINSLKKGERVVFVDDVLSTGGTLIAIVKALKNIGVKIIDIIIVIEKGENKKKVEKEIGMKIKTLIKVEIENGKVVIKN